MADCASQATGCSWPQTPSGYAMSRSVFCSGFLDLTLCRRLSPARQMAVPAVSLGEHHEQFPKSHMQAIEQGKDHWAKNSIPSQGHLVNPCPLADAAPRQGTRIVQPRLRHKLRGCDLVSLRVRDVCHGSQVAHRAIVMQRKTHRPVQFEITPTTRESLESWMKEAGLGQEDYLFPSRIHASPHICTRQYARILHHWVAELGLDTTAYGTHSMRRSKASMIYKKTKNLRAVQILLGHTKLESTVRYLGIEVDDALDLAEQLDV